MRARIAGAGRTPRPRTSAEPGRRCGARHRRRAGPARRHVRPALRDREPDRATSARWRRAVRAELEALGPRGRGGRHRRRDRRRRAATCSRGSRPPGRAHGDAVCAHLDTVPLDGAGRGRAAPTACFRNRHDGDPRRRQQGGRRGPARGRPGAWTRAPAAGRRASCVFTTSEEIGLRGAQGVRPRPRSRPSSATSSTTRRPIGELIVAAPTLLPR